MGFDSVRLMGEIDACNRPGLPPVDWSIKWNPRSTAVAALGTRHSALGARLDGDVATHWERPRDGKRVTTWEQPVTVEGSLRPVRRVLRLIERSIDKRGQVLIVPELTLEGWTTSLAGEFGANDRAAKAFARLHGELFAASTQLPHPTPATSRILQTAFSACRGVADSPGKSQSRCAAARKLRPIDSIEHDCTAFPLAFGGSPPRQDQDLRVACGQPWPAREPPVELR
jgi:hypothetical protein